MPPWTRVQSSLVEQAVVAVGLVASRARARRRRARSTPSARSGPRAPRRPRASGSRSPAGPAGSRRARRAGRRPGRPRAAARRGARDRRGAGSPTSASVASGTGARLEAAEGDHQADPVFGLGREQHGPNPSDQVGFLPASPLGRRSGLILDTSRSAAPRGVRRARPSAVPAKPPRGSSITSSRWPSRDARAGPRCGRDVLEELERLAVLAEDEREEVGDPLLARPPDERRSSSEATPRPCQSSTTVTATSAAAGSSLRM